VIDVGLSFGPAAKQEKLLQPFAAWMEVYLGDRWHVFDPRNNERRIGRLLIARGRDAADVPLTHTFGPNKLAGFRVWTHETTA
jgi:transglutaminase-like putative cysteine protease